MLPRSKALDRDAWFAFYSELYPGRSRTAADVAFEVLEPDVDSGSSPTRVSHAQFVLRGHRALRADVLTLAARLDARTGSADKVARVVGNPLSRIDSDRTLDGGDDDDDDGGGLDDDESDVARRRSRASDDSTTRRARLRRKWRVAIAAIVASVRLRDADLGPLRKVARSATAPAAYSLVARAGKG